MINEQYNNMISIISIKHTLQLFIYIPHHDYISMINRVNSNSHSQQQRKAQLIGQIQDYRCRINHFKSLQAEIQAVNKMLKVSSKSIEKESRFEQRLPLKQKPRRSSKSSLKIKSYQVQKKLNTKQKEYRQKNAKNINKLQQHEQILLSIQDLQDLIKNEQNQSDRISRQTKKAELDAKSILNQIQQFKVLIEQEQKILQMYTQQKINKISQIKQMKKQLKNSSQDTEIGEDLRNSQQIGQELEKNNMKTYNKQIRQFSESEECLLSEDYDFVKSEYSDDLQISKQNSAYFHKNWANQSPFDQFRDHQAPLTKRITRKLFSPKSDFLSFGKLSPADNQNQQQKNSPKISNILNPKFLQQRNQELKDQLKLAIEKSNTISETNLINEHKLTHKKITAKLLQNKLNHHQNVIQDKMKYIKSVYQKGGLMQKLNYQYGSLCGQLGSLRGKIGVKVQNNKILALVNSQIEHSHDELFMKYQRLQKIKEQVSVLVNLF